MEYQDNKPSDNPTDRADEHGKQIDGYVVRKYEVRQEEENHPQNRVADEVSQKTPAARQHEQEYSYHQYEYDELHRSLFYTMRRSVFAAYRLTRSLGAFLLSLFTLRPSRCVLGSWWDRRPTASSLRLVPS